MNEILYALKEDSDSERQDDLLDLLDQLGVTVVPSRENFKVTLLQVAHKQIIQQPKHALYNMSAVAGEHLRATLTITAQIQAMYEDKNKKKPSDFCSSIYRRGG